MMFADLAITLALIHPPTAFDSLRAASAQELFRIERQLHHQLAGPSVRGPGRLEDRYRLQIKLRKLRSELERRESEGDIE